MRSSVTLLEHTVVSFQQQQQLLLLVSCGTRGSPGCYEIPEGRDPVSHPPYLSLLHCPRSAYCFPPPFRRSCRSFLLK